MEPAKQLLPVGPVSILASFGPLIQLSEQCCCRSFLGLNWITALPALLVVAAGTLVILAPGMLVPPFFELKHIVAELGDWLQLAVVLHLEATGRCWVSAAWFTSSLVATVIT